MNREEIEFRGKGLKNKKWHYGFLIFWDGTICIQEIHNISPSMDAPLGDLYVEYVSVDPETIGQYTRRKDKNDDKIYEGDIIIGGLSQESCVVIWDEYCGRWIAKGKTYKVLGHKFPMFERKSNIHDIELLKERS